MDQEKLTWETPNVEHLFLKKDTNDSVGTPIDDGPIGFES